MSAVDCANHEAHTASAGDSHPRTTTLCLPIEVGAALWWAWAVYAWLTSTTDVDEGGVRDIATTPATAASPTISPTSAAVSRETSRRR
jgi:hypothetical protein